MLQGVEAGVREEQEAEPSDADLAARSAADRQAFLALYDRYVRRLELYVAARTGSSEVEDLVSVTFLRALSSIGTYRPERGLFAAWLFRIARNVVADHYRGRTGEASVEVPERVMDERPGPEGMAVAREERERIGAALTRLTAEQCDALALRYAADLSFAAVAKALGKSEPAAKMLVQRGLRALRRQLEEDRSA